jgi:hypothetical protein
MHTDPLIKLLDGASEDPVGVVARTFGYLEPTRTSNPGGYFSGIRALARTIAASQPAFAVALAEYVAENGDPDGGARTAILLRATNSGASVLWGRLHESVKAVPYSNVRPESVAGDLHLYLPAVAAATRAFRGIDPIGLRLGSLYCLGQLRLAPQLAVECEDLLIGLVDSADRGSIRRWLEEASTRSSLGGLAQALNSDA